MAILEFPGRRRQPVTSATLPDDTLERLQIELARAQIDLVRNELWQTNFLWIWFCLKRVIFWGFLLWLLMSVAKAEQRSFYDSSGRFAGSSVERGNSTSVYDRSGRFDGSIIRNSNGTKSYYDGRGRFTGSSTEPRR